MDIKNACSIPAYEIFDAVDGWNVTITSTKLLVEVVRTDDKCYWFVIDGNGLHRFECLVDMVCVLSHHMGIDAGRVRVVVKGYCANHDETKRRNVLSNVVKVS